MDGGTVNGDRAHWDSVAVETARRHPLAVATWLAADTAVNALMRLQETVEAKLRQTPEATGQRAGAGPDTAASHGQ